MDFTRYVKWDINISSSLRYIVFETVYLIKKKNAKHADWAKKDILVIEIPQLQAKFETVIV